MIKRLITISMLTLLLFFGMVPAVSAYDPIGVVCNETDGEVCETPDTNPVADDNGVIMRVVSLLSWVVGIASVIMVLLGGLKYITANGDPNATSSAKNTILYALIGVAVAMFAKYIVIFVLNNI